LRHNEIMARHRQGWNLTTIRMLVMVVALAHCLTSAGAPQSKIILGVLEDHVGEYIDQPDFRGVRVVFQKDGTDWKAFPSDCADQDCLRRIVSEYPGEVTWTIAFDGRNLGQITSRALTSHDFYSQIGLQQITSTNSIPTIGKKSTDYGGFIGGSVYRPLVANSQPYFKDPDRWKSVQISDELLIALRRKFRQQFPKVIRCEGKD